MDDYNEGGIKATYRLSDRKRSNYITKRVRNLLVQSQNIRIQNFVEATKSYVLYETCVKYNTDNTRRNGFHAQR